MKNWIIKNFTSILVILLFIIIILQKCGSNKKINNKNYSDTTRTIIFETHDSIIYTKPQIINSYRHDSHTDSVLYQASDNPDTLVQQYSNIKNQFLMYNIYKDSTKIDSLGYISIIDTVNKNQLTGRSISSHLTIPIITNTIIQHIFEKPRAQFFIGANISGSPVDPLKQIGGEILYKSKKNQIWTFGANYDLKQGVNYTIGRLIPLKFKK